MNILGIVILLLCPQRPFAEVDLYSRLALLEVTVSSLLKTDAEQTETIRLQEVKMKEQSEEIKELKQIIQDIQTRERLTPMKPMKPKLDLLPLQHQILNNQSGDQKSARAMLKKKIVRSDRTINATMANYVPRTARRGIIASPVAFTAVKVISQDNIGVNQNIQFENVVLNDGGGFHANHGIFIAPVGGYYLFTTSFLHSPGPIDIRVGLMHNGRLMAKVSGSMDQSSMTLVLKIAAGDEVWLENKDVGSQSIYGGYYSSFSGVLLHQL
ncbi:uncharacterized protein LOC127850121 [Dreissena polymorpha]|uniref:C1q domain-containing protein n=1 Tax=Dreissena polymorpha TaxID=45954 RepID=A0A9D4N7A0_DREPO|nr:uncharacterized protein LOC127850121 [Dreissena polymorpha]KAH3889178.1 hypothetical protein DPMN_013228 [Dreissena polymorpha]